MLQGEWFKVISFIQPQSDGSGISGSMTNTWFQQLAMQVKHMHALDVLLSSAWGAKLTNIMSSYCVDSTEPIVTVAEGCSMGPVTQKCLPQPKAALTSDYVLAYFDPDH